jgi:division protein CdvB (Snf7/Vps24/ESCRT-III family)
VRKKIFEIASMLRNDCCKINEITQEYKLKEKELFNLCVCAQVNKDLPKAEMYANEIAELRSRNYKILRTQSSLEEAIITLENIEWFGNAREVLSSVVRILKQIEEDLTGVLPEVVEDLVMVRKTLDAMLYEVRCTKTEGERYSSWIV